MPPCPPARQEGCRSYPLSYSRIVITFGNSALGPNQAGGLDLVAMDDFISASLSPRRRGLRRCFFRASPLWQDEFHRQSRTANHGLPSRDRVTLSLPLLFPL